ncbi:hypothetical protein HN873_052452 [Arachis hypogaea]
MHLKLLRLGPPKRIRFLYSLNKVSFVDCQARAFQELRAAMKSVKNEVLKTKRSYLEDFKYFGAELSNGKVAETKVLKH